MLSVLLPGSKKIADFGKIVDEIRQTALKTGLKNLLADGMEKIREGLTTLNELSVFLDENFFAEMFPKNKISLRITK